MKLHETIWKLKKKERKKTDGLRIIFTLWKMLFSESYHLVGANIRVRITLHFNNELMMKLYKIYNRHCASEKDCFKSYLHVQKESLRKIFLNVQRYVLNTCLVKKIMNLMGILLSFECILTIYFLETLWTETLKTKLG